MVVPRDIVRSCQKNGVMCLIVLAFLWSFWVVFRLEIALGLF